MNAGLSLGAPDRDHRGQVRFTPNFGHIAAPQQLTRCAKKRHFASQQTALLFDNLGAAEQREQNGEAERLRGFEIEKQLDFDRLLDRQSGVAATGLTSPIKRRC